MTGAKDAPEGAAGAGPGKTPGLRLLLEAGPLGVFFFSNAKWGIFVATGVFMVAIVASLLVSWRLEKRLPIMPLVTAAFVLVFGGLTLILRDELFIKLKPTIVNALFAAILLGGLATGRSFLKPVLETALPMREEGWKQLTLRFGLFFIVLAVLNEVVWRNFSTDAWVSFKVFGIMPLTLVFTMTQMGLIRRHAIDPAGS